MTIFRTSRKTIQTVVQHSKHALKGCPELTQGDLILVSELVTECFDDMPIKYVMEYVRCYKDDTGESETLWGKQWKYMIEGKNCRPLRSPFNINRLQVSDKNYGQGGPWVHVDPADEKVLRERGLLS
jgi:hypothetical protein